MRVLVAVLGVAWVGSSLLLAIFVARFIRVGATHSTLTDGVGRATAARTGGHFAPVRPRRDALASISG